MKLRQFFLTAAAIAAAALGGGAGPVSAAESVYTSVKSADCVLFETGEIGASMVCKGAFGFNVVVSDVDARIFLRLVHPDFTGDVKVNTTQDIANFTWLGSEVVEWRVEGGAPFAFIARLGVQLSDAGEKTSRLLVARVDPKSRERTCLIGIVKTNEEAHALADRASSTPCRRKHD